MRPEPAVIGHSFGGGVAIKLAHDHAARVRSVRLPHDHVSLHLSAPGTNVFTDRGDASGTGAGPPDGSPHAGPPRPGIH